MEKLAALDALPPVEETRIYSYWPEARPVRATR